MRSIFELKNKTAIDLAIFDRMKQKAIELLSDAECDQYTQAVVLLSALGNEYGAIIKNALSEKKKDETHLIHKIKDQKDTEIRCVLCMWHDQSIDIPSFAFRELLLALNRKNTETILFVMTASGVSGIKLSGTMK